MWSKEILYCFIAVQLICIFAEEIPDSIVQQFIESNPIHPTVNIPDVIVPEMDDVRIEPQSNYTGNFEPFAECSQNITDLQENDVGTITTPNYPRNYPGRTSCEWYLESPPNTRIELNIFDLYTQPWFFTYFDYILIAKDGNFSTVDRLAGDMNSKTPMTLVSDENKIGIRFSSSTFFNFRGLKLQYLVKPIEEEPFASPFDSVCGQSFILDEDKPPSTTEAPAAEETSSNNPANVPILTPGENTTQAAVIFDLDNSIITPDVSPPHSFPWMAALLIDGRSFCGGSIIDEQHILTAAHCTDGAKRITVLLGAHDIKMKEDNRLLFNVTREGIFQHPDYNPNTITHDISIIRLPEKIQFNKRMVPICLPNRYYLDKTFVGERVRVSGWGKPSDRAAGINSVLKNTTISILSNGQCRTTFRSLVTGNLICTATEPTASPCRGDSGGPLVVKEYNPAGLPYFLQVGIVSFGGNSCQRGIPVGFTRVTAFLEYISTITGKGY